MNSFIITNMLECLHNCDSLLAPTIITPAAEQAIAVYTTMVNSLPADSLVLDYLTANPLKEIYTTAIFKDGVYSLLQQQLSLGSGYSVINVPNSGGVYVFTFSDLTTQYVGSAYDFKLRLLSHIWNLQGHGNPLKFHTWVINNGGMSHLSWGQIYSTPNYYIDFLATNPSYSLSLGETEILMALSQLIPRILEQSLFLHHLPTLNDNKWVDFEYLSWTPALLAVYSANKTIKLIEIRDLAGNLLRPHFESINLTAKILGLSTNTIKRYLNNSTGFMSNVFGKQITVGVNGVPYNNNLIVHRVAPKNPPLVLSGGSLTDLIPFHITAFYPDKVNYLGPFVSTRDLEKALNPEKYPGDARPTRTNMTIHRARNLERLYKCDLGEFYIAANPDFLPMKQPLAQAATSPWR